jgi:hypothetical protein
MRSNAFLVNGLILAPRRVVVVTCAFHERTQIIQCDSTVDLSERPLDDVLEVSGTQSAAAIQCEEVTPRLWSETAALVWTEDSKIQGTKALLA